MSRDSQTAEIALANTIDKNTMPTGPLFHVTPERNLASILSDGLAPQIGPRSGDLGEPAPRIFFFTTLEAVETALTNWLGEAFEDEPGALVVLSVDPSGLTFYSEADYEVFTHEPILAENITLGLGLDQEVET
ncbi:hypothetical protein [Pseudomonas sp. 2FE]|uniref:hypothetical protein n=1 Tax=Pseudomonas sp. 2FE TaxID=2502190 RepID=UPI0010F4F0DF|nr:hypothetical protein [Pseudomonas sp. 2FE]